MFDRYHDVAQTLEDPPSHVMAARQLGEAKIEFVRIVAVNPEAILYTVADGERERAWTAWTEVRDEKRPDEVVIYRQTGFPALPSPYLKDTG